MENADLVKFWQTHLDFTFNLSVFNNLMSTVLLSLHLFLIYSLLFQHPCVHDEVSGVSLVGLPALQALLYHCQYFQHVAFSASNCYQGRYTFHLQSCADAIIGPSPQESNLLGRFYVCVDLIMWIWSDCILEQVSQCMLMCHVCMLD